jgi:outer membrane protein OmpA-like peptidoglycan-associated protein
LEVNRNNLHHGIGFIYLWPKNGIDDSKNEMPTKEDKMDDKKSDMSKDTDRDGIEDKLDLCPNESGIKSLSGCPDKDNDGVADFQDPCPDVAGLVQYKGCPDSDGDGVPDNEDKCPTQNGSKMNSGCPELSKDTDGDGITDDLDRCPDYFAKTATGCPDAVKDSDGDGIADSEDKCPDMKGITTFGGCPDTDNDGIPDPDDKCKYAAGLKLYGGCPDSDGDGIPDDRDKCPNTVGTVASNGCPDIKIEDRKTLDVAMRAVQFELGKATLKSESFTILQQVASLLQRYPDYNLAIGGHTDNTGSSVANQELSEKRAKACYDYIISRGVSADRLSYTGFGESRPVADNATENGRSLNRRVEFNLNPR